jgi:hypothetical protein
MRRTVPSLLVAAALAIAGCATTPSAAPPTGHGDHAPVDDPKLEPAGDTGTPALGQPIKTMDELSAWVRDMTGECHDVTKADDTELADYLGPTRVTWYGPFVAEWATCGIAPYDKLGLVLFGPGQQRALQEFWQRGLASGQMADNPDWAFGNGFAVTAGPLGIDRLGLHYLTCEPTETSGEEHTVPADIEGCVYSR